MLDRILAIPDVQQHFSCSDILTLSVVSKLMRQACQAEDLWRMLIARDFGIGGLRHDVCAFSAYYRYQDLHAIAPKTNEECIEAMERGDTHLLNYSWDHLDVRPTLTHELYANIGLPRVSSLYIPIKNGHLECAKWLYEKGYGLTMECAVAGYRQFEKYPEVARWISSLPINSLPIDCELESLVNILLACLVGKYRDQAVLILKNNLEVFRTMPEAKKPLLISWAISRDYYDISTMLMDLGFFTHDILATISLTTGNVQVFRESLISGYKPNQKQVNLHALKNYRITRECILNGIYPSGGRLIRSIIKWPQLIYILVNKGYRFIDHRIDHVIWQFKNIRIIKFLYRHGYRPTVEDMNNVFKQGDLSVIRFLINRGHVIGNIDEKCKQRINIPVMKYLFTKGYVVSQFTVDLCVEKGRLRDLQFLLNSGYLPTPSPIFQRRFPGSFPRSFFKNTEVIKLLNKHGIPHDSKDIFKYLMRLNNKLISNRNSNPYHYGHFVAVCLDYLYMKGIYLEDYQTDLLIGKFGVNVARVLLRWDHIPSDHTIGQAIRYKDDNLLRLYRANGYFSDLYCLSKLD